MYLTVIAAKYPYCLIGMLDALCLLEHKEHRRKSKMKKAISTIVTIGLLSSMLVNTAYAGNHHGGGINPAWIPVAIISTLAAVAITQAQPVVHERHVVYEPVREVRYVEPRYYRYERYYEQRPHRECNEEREDFYEERRYRNYR